MLVSAFIADGPPSRVLEAALDGRLELIVPRVVLDELARVFRLKLGFDEARTEAAVRRVETAAVAVAETPDDVESVTGDEADDRIVAAAVAAGAEILVTGDRLHLLPLAEHRGVRIVKPQTLLAELA